MRGELRVLTGSKAGLVLPVTSSESLVGRNDGCMLRFDPEVDLDVSARHALIERIGAEWWLRDLDSTNGTWVNGRRLHAPVQLAEGDRITFGQDGPLAEWRLRPTRLESTTKRIRAQVARHVHRVRVVSLALLAVALSATITLLVLRARQQSQWERERVAMRQQIDSLLAVGQTAIHSLQGEVEGLSEALRASEAQVRQASQELDAARARLSDNEADQLRRQLQASREALRRLQLAASLDFRSIENKNRSAIAMVYAEAEDGTASSATAFAVRPAGLLITSRHLVSDARGQRRPRRLALQFSDSNQLWNASVVAVSTDADLALIRVSGIIGDVPVIPELNLRGDTIPPGSPVAVIGFPMGGVAPSEKGRSPAQPLLSAAIIKGFRQGALVFEGYGAGGASGSPIFDKNGRMVGVLFGGYVDPASGQNFILGASAADVVRLMESVR